LHIKLTHRAFLEKAVKSEKSENATAKAVKPSTSLTAANNPDKIHQARDDILINNADNYDETKTGVPELATGGNQDVAMDDHAKKDDSEDDSEEEEEGEDVICNGFNNHLTADEELSAFDIAHLLSGMSQEYIFNLLKFLKVR
jgi:hypothetical protein